MTSDQEVMAVLESAVGRESEWVTAGGILYVRPLGGTVWQAGVRDRAGKVMVLAAVPNGLAVGGIDAPFGPHVFDQSQAAALADALRRYALHGDVRPPTRVVSVRGMDPEEVRARGIVYVGRDHRARDGLSRGKVVYKGHILQNPFKLLPRHATLQQRADCVRQYREHLHAKDGLLKAARELRGRCLGCWCGTWDGTGDPGFECHAVEIAKVADAEQPGLF